MHRRVFLHTTVGLACASAACSSTPEGHSAASGPVSGGNLKDVPVGTVKAIGGQPVILARDSGGLYAMTAICTHRQCDMTRDGSVSATEIVCDCHGSTFSANGAVTTGPANAPLEHFKVDLTADGTITVQAGQVVAASARTATP